MDLNEVNLNGTYTDVAKMLKISPSRVRQLSDQGVLPKPEKPGQWDLLSCVHEYFDFKGIRQDNRPLDAEGKLAEACRAAFESLPDRLSTKLPARHREAILEALRAEIDLLLDELMI